MIQNRKFCQTYSTVYVYFGLVDEHAPRDTTIAIIDPSVTTIRECAFTDCEQMKRCIMNNNVNAIEGNAFSNCVSLDTLFLSSSLKKIENKIFIGCTNIRILSLPHDIITFSHIFFLITHPPCEVHEQRFNQAILDFYRNLPPLHKACLDTNLSLQSIR